MEEVTDFGLLAADVDRQSDLLAASSDRLRADANAVANAIGDRPSRIYLVGCGDSLNVGMAVRVQWERLIGVPVMAVPAMTFARYEADMAPSDALVVALSVSGSVVRVVEAIRVSMARGLRTIAVTGTAGSALANESSTATLVTEYPKLGFVPGTTSYAFNMQAFFLLGLALGTRWGVKDATLLDRDDQLARIPALIQASLPTLRATARAQAASFRPSVPVLCLGSGPNLANAHFLARKLFEVSQVMAFSQETEEYAHDEHSIVGPAFQAVVLAPPDAGFGRATELIDSLLSLQVSTAVVTDARGKARLDRAPTWIYELEGALDLPYSPLLYALPAEILCHELALVIGGSFYATQDPLHAAVVGAGDDLIYAGEILASTNESVQGGGRHG
jgi:glucosamine--fructose-6-phosphate aminotransferase (isomerizing)